MDMSQSGSRNEAKGSTRIPIFDRQPVFFRFVREVFTNPDFAVGRIAASQTTGYWTKMALVPPPSLPPLYERAVGCPFSRERRQCHLSSPSTTGIFSIQMRSKKRRSGRGQ
jgi:hypothetical protein